MSRKLRPTWVVIAFITILVFSIVGCGIRELTPRTDVIKPTDTSRPIETTNPADVTIPTEPTEPLPTETIPPITTDPPETMPVTEPPNSQGAALREEARSQALDQFIDLNECTYGEWDDQSNGHAMLVRDIFNKDGEKIGVEIDYPEEDPQTHSHTYIFKFPHENVESGTVVREFYGDGTRYSVTREASEPNDESSLRIEKTYYNKYGWYFGVDVTIGKNNVASGVSYDPDNPKAGFLTYTVESVYLPDEGYRNTTTNFRYDYAGVFLGGDKYGPGLEQTEISRDNPPAEDQWRDYWVETFDLYHNG